MKTSLIVFSLFLASLCFAQSTLFIYDQQSSTESYYGSGAIVISEQQPLLGQSFTPSLSGIGFVRFGFYDGTLGNTLSATVSVNLRSDSITGSILGTTIPAVISSGVGSGTNSPAVNLFFPSEVSLVPGTVYYLQPVFMVGNQNLQILSYHSFNYAGGSLINFGVGGSGSDMWFREGIIVPAPEPETLSLGLLGAGLLWAARQRAKV